MEFQFFSTITHTNQCAGRSNLKMAAASEKGRQIPIVCRGHTRPLAELQFRHLKEENRTLLISACHDTMPMVRDGTNGDWIGTFVGQEGAVWSCRMDPSGSLAATASGDYSARVWDAISGASLWQFNHKHIVKTCDFSLNSRYLATGGHEGVLRIFDLTQPKQEPLMLTDTTSANINKCVWWTDDVLLTGNAEGVIAFWEFHPNGDQSNANPVAYLKTENGAEVRDLELSHLQPGMDVLTVAAGDKVYFFHLQEKKLLHAYKMPIHFRDEGGASLHPSGKRFAAGGNHLWLRVFDFATGEQLEHHQGHHGPIRCVRYSPDGSVLASGSEDGTIRLWKTDL